MTRRLLTILAALTALALLAGCGGDKKTIPRDDGSSLIRLLRLARDQAGDLPDKCPQLQLTVQRIQARVASLPASVDQDTRDSLVNGVNNLIDNARTECEGSQTTPTTETTPTEPTPTETQETEPTETQETEPQTTPTTPPPTTPTQPGNGGVTPGTPPEVAPGQQKHGGKKGGEE